MTDRRFGNVRLVKNDGSGHRPLTSGKFSELSPRWSPDGKRLVFVSNRGGTTQLWQRFMDTGEMSALTNVGTAPSSPSWSADGMQIAYLALVPKDPLVIGTLLTPPAGAT